MPDSSNNNDSNRHVTHGNTSGVTRVVAVDVTAPAVVAVAPAVVAVAPAAVVVAVVVVTTVVVAQPALEAE